MTPSEVLQFAKENGARQVDVRFADIPGLQHHISYPIGELNEGSFTDGFGIDGSSIRGWAAINESDMLLIPDASTAFMDPFMETPTLVMIGDVRDPLTRQNYERDPRWIAKKAELYLQNSGVGDTAFSAPRRSSSFSTMSVSIRTRTRVSTLSTPKRAGGIRVAKRTISATGRATKKAIFRCLRRTIIRTSAPRW